MTNENTDTDNTDSDESSKAELHERVEQLESTVEKLMPSRRDALRMGVAGLAGAAGVAGASQSVDASTGSAGAIGSNSDRPTIFADDIDANSLAGSVKNQGCRVFLSSDQNISSLQKIKFDSEVYDSGNNFSTSSHNWTCPHDGIYAVNLQVLFSGGSDDENRTVFIGTATNEAPNNEGARNSQNSSDSDDRISVSTINKYSSGDTIAAHAVNFVTGNDSLSSGSSAADTFMEVAFLGGV